MEWQTLLTVTRSTLPHTEKVLDQAGYLGACLKENGYAGWQIGWGQSTEIRSEEVMNFRSEQMKPLIADITTILAGLPCYVSEADILWDIPASLQKEMGLIKGQIDQAVQNQNKDVYIALLKRLWAVRRLWTNTREKWTSDSLWVLLFDEVSRVAPHLCALVVGLSAYGIPVEEQGINPATIPEPIRNNHSKQVTNLLQLINSELISKVYSRYQVQANTIAS